MNWRLAILRLYLPPAVKRNKLRELLSLTADAFGCAAPGVDTAPIMDAAPSMDGLSHCDCLRRYALFTREQAEKALERGSGLPKIRDRLYRNAHRFGQRIRRQLRVATPEEAVAAMRILYRAIGIDLAGELPGEVVIDRCFFSDFYSEEVCRLISALDAGVAAGISGDSKLEFYQRLTGGYDCCRAHFRFKEDAR
ncbi:MAG: hypothetical protein ACM3X4_02310 [Ignavibacteriales bacterium]